MVNIARGEIIDEEALIIALDQGKLRGFATDVYDGEFERPPDIRLWDDERVVITPHVSAATDISEHRWCEVILRKLAPLSRRTAVGKRHRLAAWLLKFMP